ncbi:MAG: CsbD family protein [Rhodobacteraceae bacterium]|nr:MAG: CsbD family protein [Paracoccaceae bacterium]
MNWDQIKGKWTQVKGSARSKWGELTDDDIEKAAGQKDRMVGIIQEKYGIAKHEAEKQVDEWTSTL